MNHDEGRTNQPKGSGGFGGVSGLGTTLSSVVIAVDYELCVRGWNQGAEDCFGLPAEHVMGLPFGACGIAWEAESYRAWKNKVRQGDPAGRAQIQFVNQDGSDRVFGLTLTVMGQDGQSGGILLGKDITESHQENQYKARLASAVEQASESIAIADSTGLIQYCNSAYERVTGCTWMELREQGANLLTEPGLDCAEGVCEGLQETLQRGEAWSGHKSSQHEDGSAFEEEITITPLRDSLGTVVEYVTVRKDVTEKLGLEVQLRSAQKLESMGQLATGIAHEINTPTQFVSDNTRFLRDTFNELSDLLTLCAKVCETEGQVTNPAQVLQSIAEAGSKAGLSFACAEIPGALEESLGGLQRISEIVSAMKTFSHPGVVDKVPVDLNEVIRTALTLSSNEWKYVAEVETDFDPNLELIDGLPGDLGQVILNLIVNAAHAIQDGPEGEQGELGTIWIWTRTVGAFVEIKVKDSGCGMPAQVAERIFDPFFTTKEVGRGTGQGLAIVHSAIVNKHSGQVLVDTTPGGGTTFTIQIPLNSSTGKATAA